MTGYMLAPAGKSFKSGPGFPHDDVALALVYDSYTRFSASYPDREWPPSMNSRNLLKGPRLTLFPRQVVKAPAVDGTAVMIIVQFALEPLVHVKYPGKSCLEQRLARLE